MPPSPATSRQPSATKRHLPLRLPFDAGWLFSFLAGRAVPGVETVDGCCYRRRLDAHQWIEVRVSNHALDITIPPGAAARTEDIVARVGRIFDTGADPEVIDRRLAAHPKLAPMVRAAPGVRVPGVWDPFEGVVRAILGQQVSVTRATALATTLCERFGHGAFPGPRTLADADVAAIGLPGMRGRAISAVATRVVEEGVAWLHDADALRAGFAEIPGLGPWTAEYAAMRVGRDPDAFPDSDWGVVKALGLKGPAARRWAAPCRPWRAYAVMHLWRSRPG